MDERDRPGASLPTPRRRGFLCGVGASALGTFAVSADRSAAASGGEPQRRRAAASRNGVRQQQRNGLSIGGDALGYAQAGSTPSLNFSDSLEATIELWINHDGTSEEDAILLEKNEGGSNGYQISFDGGGEEPPLWFGWKFPNSNNWKVTSNSGIPANTWTHVACVYDGSQQAIYIDGELDATRTGWNDEQMNGNDAPFVLGANSQANERFFSGELDEIRLWNTARSLLQIRGSWLTTLSGEEEDLLAYYQFDGGTTADAAGANDLELVAGAALASPGALPAPPKLYARAGDGEVSLRWNQRVGPTGQNEATAFRLYRSTTPDGSDRTQIDEFGPDTTTTTVSATNGEIGYYWLSAVDDEDHESDLSYPAVALPSSRPFGRALSFPGSDSRVTVDDRPRLDMPTPTETTIEFWVRHDGESAENAVLVGKNESNANGYLVSFTGSTVEPKIDFGMKFPNSDNWKLVSTGGVPQGEWTHVACVYDGNKQVIYIDGELDSTREDWNNESMNGNSAPLRFGAADDTGQRLFSGQLDDVRIWDTPRTIRQIQNNYQRELYGDEEGLLAYWRTADGGTVRGSVGSALTGALDNVDVSESEFGTTDTPTDTPTEADTPTPTEADTPTPTEADTPTPTDADTPTPTESPTPADGGTPTESPTPTPTESPTPPPTESPTPTPTEPPTPTTTAGQTATATESPTATAVPTTAGSQRGFFTNGGNGPLGFLNEVTLTVIGIVISILSIVVEMLGLRGGN